MLKTSKFYFCSVDMHRAWYRDLITTVFQRPWLTEPPTWHMLPWYQMQKKENVMTDSKIFFLNTLHIYEYICEHKTSSEKQCPCSNKQRDISDCLQKERIGHVWIALMMITLQVNNTHIKLIFLLVHKI